MRAAIARKRVAALLGLGVASVNFVAYRQARAFTHFAPPGQRTRPELLSFGGKIEVLLAGVQVPRPENERTPRDVGLAYERHVFEGGRGVALEAWFVPRPDARGTVVLFHGHAASKDSQLREARAFHDMGMNVLLVDFHGSGGSGGNETSIGFHEALDVTKALGYANDLPGSGPVVLYGASMGAAAVLKAVADDSLGPAALILECPFGSLVTTVRHRFRSFGVPPFPFADLLVFWGGVDQGFNGLRYRPLESASQIERPTLLMTGARDPWVRPHEARAIFDGLKGFKRLRFFADVGHDSCLRRRPGEWRSTVGEFLDDVLPPADRRRNAEALRAVGSP
jgi:alpha-beta hydrolase superfamily lysophospholipase